MRYGILYITDCNLFKKTDDDTIDRLDI